jgi:hypothetical protein
VEPAAKVIAAGVGSTSQRARGARACPPWPCPSQPNHLVVCPRHGTKNGDPIDGRDDLSPWEQ